MRRAGFTIFELLVVIVLLAAAGGLVVTLSAGWLRGAAFREAGRQVEAFLALARAESQRRGETLRVVARRDDDGVALLALEPLLGPSEAGADERAGDGFDGAVGDGVREVIDSMPLPSGVTISHTLPAAPGDTGSSHEEAGGAPSARGVAGRVPDLGPAVGGGSDDEGTPVVIVGVVLPDGQVVPARERLYLVSDGRAVRLSVNGWTGAVESVEIDAGSEGGTEPRDDPPPPVRSSDPARGEEE